jgi:hypothetical protein
VKFGDVLERRSCKYLISMAPEVGLEPTTLRLTARESVNLSLAISYYKLL